MPFEVRISVTFQFDLIQESYKYQIFDYNSLIIILSLVLLWIPLHIEIIKLLQVVKERIIIHNFEFET